MIRSWRTPIWHRISRRWLPYGTLRPNTSLTEPKLVDAKNALVEIARNPDDVEKLVNELPPDCRNVLGLKVLQTYSNTEHDAFVATLRGSSVRSLAIACLSRHFGQDFRKVFDSVDENQDGVLQRQEFSRFFSCYSRKTTSSLDGLDDDVVEPPTQRQLFYFGLNSAIPFVVFVFLDNSIMIIGGDIVDDMIGSAFKLSTLACAAVANTFADVIGISIGNTVEALTEKMGIPAANFTTAQTKLPLVRRVGMISGSFGIFVGCIMGMTPLLFIDEDVKAMKEAFKNLDADDDGFIQAREIQKLVATLNSSIVLSDDTLQKLVASFDKDGDGKISFAEFSDKYSSWQKELGASR